MSTFDRLRTLRSTGLRYAVARLRAERALRAAGRSVSDDFYLRVWSEAANELGAEVSELSARFLQIARGGASTRVWGYRTPLDDRVTLEVAADKVVSSALLRGSGVPVPRQLEFDRGDLASAATFLERERAACVVKPAGGTGAGKGVTTWVQSHADLHAAADRAGRLSARLIIEEQVAGDVFRLIFLDGELLDAVRSRPPTVTGNGRATVRRLVYAENRRRLAARGDAGLAILRLDLDSRLTLRRQGYTLGSVLPAGARVAVKTVSNQATIDDKETVRTPISPALVADCATAVAALRLRLAGVDLIAPDIARPLAESGGRIAEVNGTPGLHHHYNVADRANVTRVAVPILERLLDDAALRPSPPGVRET